MKRFFAALHSRALALFVLCALLAVAGMALGRVMPASIFPTVTFPRVKLIADVGEQPAARMMPAVTRPLEEAVLRVAGIRRIVSTTSRGSSEISAEFAWGTDMQVALQRVQAEVERTRSDLPADTRVDVEWMNTAIFPILGYALVSDTASQAELRAFAEFTLKPELIRIPGVAQVQIQGGATREFRIELDPAALAGRGLIAADVVNALETNNRVLSAGLSEGNHELYLVLVDGRADSLAELSSIAIPVPAGIPAPLGTLGKVEVADAVSYIRTTAGDDRGAGPAVLVNIVRQPDANTLTIASGIEELFRRRPGLIPAQARWITFYDQAALVRGSVSGVRDAILIGVLLAALVLFAFLRDLRATVIAVSTIPICVALVLLGLALFGQTLNLMTLGGIAAALGLVADDAIVVVEALHRAREEGKRPQDGFLAMLPALIGSTLSTVVIFVPFAFLSGVVGAFFRPLALTMAVALVASFFLAAVLVPIAEERFHRRGPASRKASIDRPVPRSSRLSRIGHHVLDATLAHPTIAGLASLLLLGAGAFLQSRLGSDFLPTMDEGSIILDYWSPPGTSLTDTDAMLREVEHVLGGMPDVASWSRRTGTQLGFFITEPNRGDYVIRLKPRGERRDVDEVIDDLRTQIDDAEPAVHVDFGQIVEDNIADLTGGAVQPIDVKFYGEDHALLEETVRRAAAIVAKVPGVEDVFDGIVIAGPALDVKVDSAASTRLGLPTEMIHAAVEAASRGTVAGDVLLGERVYDVRVRTPAPASLSDLRLRSASGALLPLSAVAQVTTGAPEAEIDRENLKSFLGVTARLSGVDLGSSIGAIRTRLAAELPLPPGMSLEFGGQYEQQQASFRGLLAVLFAGLLLVSVILLFEFGDWRAPVLTTFVALVSLAGVFAALALTGMTFNISSFVGAIMMVGIVGENAIFVIHEAREALRAGIPVRQAWATAAIRRARPVAMTVLATAFALAPLAFALGEGAQLQQPLAIAVIGGFVLSGPLVLLVLPSLYAALDPQGRLAE